MTHPRGYELTEPSRELLTEYYSSKPKRFFERANQLREAIAQ